MKRPRMKNMKGGSMNTYPTLKEPFAFWLVKRFLPAEDNQKESIQPISNREFYGIMSMIIVALIVLDIIFHGLPL